MARYADWDAAVQAREPVTFKFMGETWEISGFDFRDIAKVGTLMEESPNDKATCDSILQFLAEHSQDKARFEALADAHQPIPVSLLLAGIRWVMSEEIGMPWDLTGAGEDADPLVRSTVSLPSAPPTGRSSPGNSRKRASKSP